MNLGARTAMWSGGKLLPSGYRQLAWIQSSGKEETNETRQEIHLKIPTSLNLGFKAKIMISSYSNAGFGYRFGQRLFGDKSNAFSVYFDYDNFSVRHNGATFTKTGSEYKKGVELQIEANYRGSGIVKTNLGVEETMPIGTSLNNANMALFTMYEAYDPWAGFRIEEFEFTDGDVVIMKFVPSMRESDGKIGLFDVIGGRFYHNVLTGEFEYGLP